METQTFIASDPKIALAKKLETFKAQAVEWENDAYRTSNEILYRILSECYGLIEFVTTAEDTKALKADLIEAAKSMGFVDKDSTPVASTVVRVVFGDTDLCRKRVSTYSTVLRIAKADKSVTAENLSEWITANGGVQEVSRPNSATKESVEEKAAKADQYLTPIAVVEASCVQSFFDVDYKGDDCVVIGRWTASGSIELTGVVNGQNLANTAKVRFASAKAKELKEEAKAGKMAEAQTETDDLVEAAINTDSSQQMAITIDSGAVPVAA